MADLQTIGQALHRQDWTYAKNYPWIPHYWVTAKQWHGDPSIVQACHFISTQGTRMLWGKSNPAIRRYVDWKGWRYWHMDYDAFFALHDGINSIPSEGQMSDWDCRCFLINRQKLAISKAKALTPDLKMPKRFEDWTRPIDTPPHAPAVATEQTTLL